jgi:mannose-1-phosphate guanylyltransferase
VNEKYPVNFDPEADVVREERRQWLDPEKKGFSASSWRLVKRDWGTYTVLAHEFNKLAGGSTWLVKMLTIKPRQNISLQKHFHREEHWVVLEGEGEFFSADRGRWQLFPKDRVHIPIGTIHWVGNTSFEKDLLILETWLGDKLEESDIERIDNEITLS